jgi:adenylate kinase
MDHQTVLIYGPAGSGKGTQAALLREYLLKADPDRSTLHVVTGDMFRKAAESAGYTGQRIRHIQDTGGLQPAFLPIWLWSSYFVENLNGDEHILIDGFPRRPEEAVIFDSAITFYERRNPVVIVLNVAEEELLRRALEVRKRADDSKELMKRRIGWYFDEVVPTIDVFRKDEKYTVQEIDGARSIEDIHNDIKARLGLA